MPAALLDGIGPSLYQRNGFRLVGLPVSASARELRRRNEELAALARLGGTPPPRPGALLPVHPAPELHAVQDAIEDLRHPERRLVQELFWFWPMPAGDEGTALLAAGDLSRASAAWRKASRASQPQAEQETAVALHNLAVLYHVRALENQRPAVWSAALRTWKAVFDNDLCWHWLAERVRRLEDPRVTAKSVAELRIALPRALLSINAALATQHLEAGHAERAAAQLAVIRQSGFAAAEVERAYLAVAEPLVETVRRECRRVVDAAEADVARVPELADEVLERTERPLAALADLLPEGHPVRDGAHDEVGLTVLKLTLIGHGGSVDDATAEDLLDRAADVAETQPAIGRILENLRVVEANVIWTTCWYCGGQAAGAADVNPVPMWGDLARRPTRLGTEVTWRTGSIKVPRCAGCRSGSDRLTLAVKLLGQATWLLVVFAVVVGIFAAAHWSAGLVLMVLALIPYVVRLVLKRSLSEDERRTREFPAVAEQLAAGWLIGVGPPGQPRR